MGDTGIITAILVGTIAMVSVSMGVVTGAIMLESLFDAKPPLRVVGISRAEIFVGLATEQKPHFRHLY